MMINYIVVAVIAYLIGSISFSVIFTKKFAGFDVRDKGSGNAGTTNVLRTAGKGLAAFTLLCDVLKGVGAVLVALLVGEMIKGEPQIRATLVELAGIFVILGHTYPIFFKFKGGKGIATALGVLLVTNWEIALICLVYALILMALSRMVSLGSIATSILFPILCIFSKVNYIVAGEEAHFSYVIFAIILAVIVIFNHRENIKRLADGTENKISFKKIMK